MTDFVEKRYSFVSENDRKHSGRIKKRSKKLRKKRKRRASRNVGKCRPKNAYKKEKNWEKSKIGGVILCI